MIPAVLSSSASRIWVRGKSRPINIKMRRNAMKIDKVASQPIKLNLKLSAKLSQNIQKEYNSLMEAVAKVPNRTSRKINFTGGPVSVAELVGYQIGWGKRVIDWYEAGIKGEYIVMPGDGFDTWNYTKIAQYFYQAYQYDGGCEQEQIFHDTTKKIIEIVEKEDQTGNLDKAGAWEWQKLQSGKYWPLSKWVQVNTVAPFKRAATEIKKLAEN